jgi:hypothetical protein
MANSFPKKRANAEQLRKKRMHPETKHGAVGGGHQRKSRTMCDSSFVVAQRRSQPSVGRTTAISEPLPPAHYLAKRVALGRRQVPGGDG